MSFGPLKNGGSRGLYYGATPTIDISEAGKITMKQTLILTGYLASLMFGYYYVAFPKIN